MIETTRPGPAKLEVLRRGRVIARDMAEVPAGRVALRVPHRMRSRWYRVRVTTGRATDAVDVHGARAPTPTLARRIVGPDLGDWEAGNLHCGRCRPFGARRVDCIIRLTEAGFNAPDSRGCAFVISIALRSTGVVLLRGYDCDSVRGTRAHGRPRWSSDVEMRALGPRPGYR